MKNNINKVLIAIVIIFGLIIISLVLGNNKTKVDSHNSTPNEVVSPTDVPTPYPTDTPIPFPKTNKVPFLNLTPTPIIINSENNSIQEEQKIQNMEFCQNEMNKYNSCINTYNTEYQHYSDCIAQYNLEMQRYNDELQSGERFLVRPTLSCEAMPISFCSKPNCIY